MTESRIPYTAPSRVRIVVAAFALLVFVAFGWSGERVKILITNDVHGHVATHVANNKIGYSLVKSYKDKLRHGNNAVLLFDAGDSFHGGSFANRDNGRSVAEAMRLTGYDLLAPGNHEFSYNSKTNNPHYYAELSKMVLDEKPVACNILFAGEPWRAVQPYKIYEFASFSLVVTGVLTPNMFRDARNTVGFDCTLLGISGRPQDKVFAEISAAVQQRLAAVVKEAKHEAKSKRVITLVLSHVGYEIGNEAEFPAGALTGRDLLRVEGVDIVADAHSHILIDPFCSHGSLYACTGKHLQSLLEITIQELDRQHIVDLRLVTAKDMQVQPDPVVEQFVRGKVHEAGLDVVVGFNREELSDDGIELRPTRLGKAICEAMAASYRTDAAIVHAGCYRSGLPKGVIDKMTFDDFMPFSGEVVILSMSRKQFEDITSNENRGSASEFVQFSCGKNIADVLTVALPKYLAEKDPRFKSFHPIAFPEKPMLDAIAEQLFEPVTNTEAADLETAA